MASAEMCGKIGGRAMTTRVRGGPATTFANQQSIVLERAALLTPPRFQDRDLEVLRSPASL